jgi:hypothetical protein
LGPFLGAITPGERSQARRLETLEVHDETTGDDAPAGSSRSRAGRSFTRQDRGPRHP